MGIRCADHVTPLYPQKLALTSPTGGGCSVGIVRSRNKATEFSFICIIVIVLLTVTDPVLLDIQYKEAISVPQMFNYWFLQAKYICLYAQH